MNIFRKMALQKIIKESNLSEIVENAYKKNEVSEQLNYKAANFNVGAGTTVMIPENIVKEDGSVDFFIQIRGIQGGDIKTANSMGIRSVVITCEAGGLGSLENQQRFGNVNFINNAISQTLNYLQKQHPEKQLKRGKLALSSFSGGGSAIANIMTNSKNIVGGEPNAVIISDGLHKDLNSPEMNAIINYGKDAQNDPTKKLVILHSAITTNKYPSTTITSDYLVKNLGLERKKINNFDPNWKGLAPKSIASKGGAAILQMYDAPEPYMNNPNAGSEHQHWETRKSTLNNMDKILGNDWK